MKFLLLLLSFVSAAIFSMDAPKKEQKRPLELVKELLVLPYGQQLRTFYVKNHIQFLNCLDDKLMPTCFSLELGKDVISNLTDIHVKGTVYLPNNVLFAILLAKRNIPNDTLICAATKLFESKGSSFSTSFGGGEVNINDIKVFAIENSNKIWIKAFSRVGKNCSKCQVMFEVDNNAQIRPVGGRRKEYVLSPKIVSE